MPPLLLKEEQIFSFKFWFDGKVRYGMYYRNELFCRLAKFSAPQRAQVYQLGSRLAQQNAVIVLTCAPQHCTLWGSLRSPLIKVLLLNANRLNLSRSEQAANEPAIATDQPI